MALNTLFNTVDNHTPNNPGSRRRRKQTPAADLAAAAAALCRWPRGGGGGRLPTRISAAVLTGNEGEEEIIISQSIHVRY